MKIIYWIGILLFLLFFSLLASLSIHEWWNVSINNNIEGYPWGLINDNPWYYENPKIYANVMLAESLILITLLLIFIIQIIKKNQKGIQFSIISLLLALIILNPLCILNNIYF